jgi:hypothetical protein
VREKYRELLEAIEENHRISSEDSNYGGKSKGTPLMIKFSNEVPDVGEFVDHMISATDPLRLWGSVTELKPDYYRVKGVDMHNGDRYSMEVSPGWIRLYLHDDACGNTALRIFTNLQQYYDPAAEMEVNYV